MKRVFRFTSVILVLFVLHLSSLPCLGAGMALPSGVKKVTTNDPLFIPLSDEQSIKKGLPWWVYVIGVAAIAGGAAAMGGGGGGGSSSSAPSTGSVTGTW